MPNVKLFLKGTLREWTKTYTYVVVLTERKVKEEVEHQLKSELEKSVECLEDRMENKTEDRMKTIEHRMEIKMMKFEKSMKNLATTGSCYVTSAPRTI
mgnify:FL=1